MEKKVINSPIRWAGSKKKILNEMLEYFDNDSKYYVEPFLGSGIVLINLLNNIESFKFKKMYVNDINPNIINFYLELKNNCEELISDLEKIVNKYNESKEKEKLYYIIRKKYNILKKNEQEKVVYFYFLMKAGFNGVYRENREGKFNVPFGRKEKISVDSNNLRFISEKIQVVEFYNCDYKDFFKELKEKKILDKAFVYCDPPYIPEDEAVNQKQELYTKDIFVHEDFVNYIETSNINKVMISMSESEKAKKIYGKYEKNNVNEIVRTINPKKIIKSTEIVFSNYKIYKKDAK